MFVHTSSEAPRLPEASAFERAAGTTSHPKQSATKVDHGLAVETRLQKLADPNACDPKMFFCEADHRQRSGAKAVAASSCAKTESSMRQCCRSFGPPWTIRWRTRVVGAFPDGQSCLNLAAARLRYIAGTAWSAKCYMNMRPKQPQVPQTGAVA
jgi:hypothetical protein